MNKPLLKNKLWIVVVSMLLLSVFNISAQCVVGGTDFDTDVALCNPALTQAQWLSTNVGTLLAAQCPTGTPFNELVFKGKHVGLTSNIMSANGGGELSGTIITNTILANGFNPGNASAGCAVREE